MTGLLSLLESTADLVQCDLSPLAGKRVLVTGAGGLIGINLVTALARGETQDVVAIGRPVVLAGDAEWFRGGRAPEYVSGPGWSGIGKFDYIVHAAGYAQPALFMAEPLETIRVNTVTLVQWLDFLKPGGRLLFLSSAEVYSGSPRIPHTEDDIGTTTPSHPRASYIESKRCGEAICHAARSQGIDTAIARLCLAYGPGVRPGDKRLMSELIEQGLAGKIVLRDSGTTLRTYGFVSEQVEMILNILLYGKQAVYNVGGISRRSVRALAEEIAELTGATVEVPRTRDTSGAPRDVSLSLERYFAEFGTTHSVLMYPDGLERTIAWHRALAGITATAE